MLVKKFEAKTMKQAVELVKLELGPEAIILNVRENDNGFGLMGQNSIEVTAAIQEAQYRAKQVAEKKLSTRARETYARTSARKQKEYISKANAPVEGGLNRTSAVGQLIDNHMNHGSAELSEEPAAMVASPVAQPEALSRKAPTQRQYIDIEDASIGGPMTSVAAEPLAPSTVPVSPVIQSHIATEITDDEEILRLKDELSQLKSVLAQFKSVPQTLSGPDFKAHPGAEDGISFELSAVYEKLLNAGMGKSLVVQSLRKLSQELTAEQRKKKPYVEGWLIRHLMNKTMVSQAPSSGRYHIFLGPTGQGKTSTIVKFASHLIKKEKKKVAILSGDSKKIGASDQLKIYSQILNIPFGVIDGDVDWATLDKQLEKIDVILIDSPGVNLKDDGDIDLIRRLIPKDIMTVKRLHFVQSIMARDQDAFDIIDRFKLFGIDDIIFTRLDEAARFGSLLNFVDRFEIPIHSLGSSSDVPSGFEFASKERVVDLIFGVSKVVKEGDSQ